MDVAQCVPQSMQLVGLDADLHQSPPQGWLPPNVKMIQWDAFSEVPKDLFESFDVVVVRDFLLVVQDNDPTTLLQNILKLLSAYNLPHV